MLDLPHLHAPIRGALTEAVQRVLDGGSYVLGDEVEAFEQEMADFTGAPYAVSCGSGSDALFLALMASGIGPGDEVICPAFSFFATASSIARLGARPVFVDVESESLNLDPEAARRVSVDCQRLRAFVPVDLFGWVARMDDFLAIGKEFNASVIEDAAQSLGSRDERGASAGTRSQMASISFYPSKVLGALGDGGMILTGDLEMASRLRSLRSHGQSTPNRFSELGINSRLDALQAAALRVKLKELPVWLAAREQIAAGYDSALAASGALPADRSIHDAELPLLYPRSPAAPARSNHHQYTVRVMPEIRDALRAGLARRGIETAIYYPAGLHQQPSLSKVSHTPYPLVQTERAIQQVLTLPSHPGLNEGDCQYVIESLIELLRSLNSG